MITIIFIVACVGFSIAGEGGSVYLINLSGSDWNQTHLESHVMNSWAFPNYLKNGDTYQVYVEFTYSPESAYARVDYELVGTGGKSFQILAHGNPLQLEAVFTNLEIDNKPVGSRYILGWRHDGDTNFIIIGKNGRYTGTGLDGSNWMRNNIDILGSRTLKQLSIPGSHDAGMSILDGHTAFGRPCNVLTQSHSIGEQLMLGVRFFDIRPVIGNGAKYLTGHYSSTIWSVWQGGNGQSIASIVTDLNNFTNNHNELIIIKLSHSLNTEQGSRSYRSFNAEEWDQLFKQLDTINYLYYYPRNARLDLFTLNDFTNKGSIPSVVIIVDDPYSILDLGSRWGKGYYLPCSWDIYDEYSNTNNWPDMVNDQIKKMYKYSEDQYFLLSWTLTQSPPQAVSCSTSIIDLAAQANMHLGHLLYQNVSASAFPNIIYFDNVQDTDVASMAMALNVKTMV